MSKTTNKYSPEGLEHAVRLVFDDEGQYGSRWQAIMSIAAKIGCAPQTLNDWFNNRRLLEPIGSIPPAEAEANFYAALETETVAASLTSISLRQTRRGSILLNAGMR